MRKRSRFPIVAVVVGMLAAGGVWAQTVRPVLQRSAEAAALPSNATNLAVTFDQTRLKKWPNSSLITVPFKVTYDRAGTTYDLGAADHLAAYHLKVRDNASTGTFSYDIFGAAKDAEKLYLENGGTAESRYAVQRLGYCESCPPDPVRVLLLFDLSSSVEASIPDMASGATDLVNALFADRAWSSKHDLRVAVAWFSGLASDLTAISNLGRDDFMNNAAAVNSTIATNIVKRPRGSSSGLVDAAEESLKALDRAADTSVRDCCPDPTRTVKVLITVSDFVHRSGEPSAAKIATLNNPGPNFLLFGVQVSGEPPNAFTPVVKAALSAATGTPYENWPEAISGIPPRIRAEAREEREFAGYEYLLYTCVAPRDLSPFTPTENRTVEVTVSYPTADGTWLSSASSFTYDTSGLKDGCFLWDFDNDEDGFYRNVTLDGAPGFDDFTQSEYLPEYQKKYKGANFACLCGVELAREDEDHSGCLPNPDVAECEVKVNCTTEDCKFGKECDQDGKRDDDVINLKVDHCKEIHQVVPFQPSDPPVSPPWSEIPDCERWVIDPEPPVDETCENACPGNCASDRFYCGNGIDEDRDARDEVCPSPPPPQTCDDSGNPAAESTLAQALGRTNTLIIPDVRRGTVGTNSWATDLRIIAEGPAPGEEHFLSPCCWNLNCLKEADGFFHGVACPRGVDVDGKSDHSADTCGFCYVEQPWVELFFLPAVNAAGNSTTPPPPTLSRRFCLPSNGALLLNDVLKAFRTAEGTAPMDVSGALVVSSNYELLLENKRTIVSPPQCGKSPCPKFVVDVDDVATVDAAARTFIKTGAAAEMGKRVPATPVSSALGPTDQAYLYHLTAPDRAANADIGIVNLTPAQVAFYVRLYHADGTLMDTKEWDVAANSVAWIQDFLTGKVGFDVYATVQVINPQGNEKWMAWASSTDATTADQFWVEGRSATVTGSTGGKLYLPNSGRLALSNKLTYLITDVELINLEATLANNTPATVSYWLASLPAIVKTVSLLEAGKAYRLIDLIADGLNLAAGVRNDTLVIEVKPSTGGVITASSHTYRLNIVAGSPVSSTVGSGMSAVPESALVTSGKSAKMPLFGGPNYNSSVVITNPTDVAVTATVRFYGALGFPYSTVKKTVPANRSALISDPQDRRAGTAEVTVTNPGSALVYLWVTVAYTGDQFAIIGR